jgi:excisionase family DNA binding protein
MGTEDARIADALAAIRRGVDDLAAAVHGRGQPSTRLLISRAEVAQRLGVPQSWVAREQRRGRLPFAKRMGRKFVYDAAQLDEYIGNLGVAR